MNLLANFFTHPLLLIGLLGAALPLIIEWLLRRRRRQAVLPTIRFLLKREEEQKIKRQDRWLLLLRCLACFLVALATARPMLRAGSLRSSSVPHVVMILDNTASMQQSVGVTTAFSESKKKAAELLRQLPAGTAVSVVAFSARAEKIVENSTECLACANKLEAVPVEEGAGPVSAGMTAASEILAKAGSPHAEIYVLSDFQKYTWMRDSNETARLSSSFAELASRGTVNLVDCTQVPDFNDAVAGLEPKTPLLSTASPATFVAEIRRFGTAPAGLQASAEIRVDGAKKLSLPYSGPGKIEFAYRFTEPGEHLVEVQIEGDRFTLDNRRAFLCSVPESYKVLLVDPAAERKGLRRSSFFLGYAIAPPVSTGFDCVTPFTVNVVDQAGVAYQNFKDYAAVALVNCESVDEALAGRLNTYVHRGGAAWIFPGPGFNPYDYNHCLFRDGAGLLPCKLAAPVMGTGELSFAPFPPEFSLNDGNTPLRASLAGFVPLGNPFQPGVESLGTILRQGESAKAATPAILYRRVARGQVAVSAVPPDLSWSTLPATGEFALLIQGVLRRLIGKPDAGINLTTGDMFEQPVLVSAQHLLLQTPTGRYERLTPVQGEDGWCVRFGPVTRHGLYEVKTIPEILARRRFVVNPSSNESDLGKISHEDLSRTLGNGWNYIGPNEVWVDTAGRRYAVTEFAPAVLWVFLAVLLIESILAARFGRRRRRATRNDEEHA